MFYSVQHVTHGISSTYLIIKFDLMKTIGPSYNSVTVNVIELYVRVVDASVSTVINIISLVESVSIVENVQG